LIKNENNPQIEITYLILCHINPGQVADLINQLHKDKRTIFVMHIDKKSHPEKFKTKLLNLIRCDAESYFTQKNINH